MEALAQPMTGGKDGPPVRRKQMFSAHPTDDFRLLHGCEADVKRRKAFGGLREAAHRPNSRG